MSGNDAARHAAGLRHVCQCVEQHPAGVEMLVDMQIERQAAALGHVEQQLQESERLTGIGGHAADGVDAERDRAAQPCLALRQHGGGVRGHMGNDLDTHPVDAALTQRDHRLDAAQLTGGFDIGMAADGDGAARAAGLHGCAGARDHRLACDARRDGAVGRDRAVQRAVGIGKKPPRARLVEMLVDVDEARQDQSTVEREHLGLRIGQLRGDGSDAAVAADADVKRFGIGGAGAQHAPAAQDQVTTHPRPLACEASR